MQGYQDEAKGKGIPQNEHLESSGHFLEFQPQIRLRVSQQTAQKGVRGGW